MINTVNKKISMDKDLLSRIKWACTFSNCVPKIKNGNLKMIEKTKKSVRDNLQKMSLLIQ